MKLQRVAYSLVHAGCGDTNTMKSTFSLPSSCFPHPERSDVNRREFSSWKAGEMEGSGFGVLTPVSGVGAMRSNVGDTNPERITTRVWGGAICLHTQQETK